jgi:hypothetical protein
VKVNNTGGGSTAAVSRTQRTRKLLETDRAEFAAHAGHITDEPQGE